MPRTRKDLGYYGTFLQDVRAVVEGSVDGYYANQEVYSPLGNSWGEALTGYWEDSAGAGGVPPPRIDVNQVFAAIESMAGQQVMRRFRPTFTRRHPLLLDSMPNTPGQEAPDMAAAMQAAMEIIREEGGFAAAEDGAFKSMLIGRVSAMHLRCDKRARRPKWWVEVIPPTQYLWDCFATEDNLRNRMAQARGRYIPYPEFLHTFPEWESHFESLKSRGAGFFTTTQSSWEGASHGDWYRRRTDEVFFVEFERKESSLHTEIDFPGDLPMHLQRSMGPEWVWGDTIPETKHLNNEELREGIFRDLIGGLLSLPMARQQMVAQGSEPPRMPPLARKMSRNSGHLFREMFRDQAQAYPGIEAPRAVDTAGYSYLWEHRVGDEILQSGAWEHEDWTMFPITGWLHEERNGSRYFCPVDLMREPQQFVNMFYSSLIDEAARSPRSTWVASSKVDPSDIQELQARMATGGIVQLKTDDLSSDLRELSKTRQGFVFERLFESAMEIPLQVVGLNRYSIGNVADSLARTSGSLVSQVGANQSATLSRLYQNLSDTKSHLYRALVKWSSILLSQEDLQTMAGPGVVVPPKWDWPRQLRDYMIKVGEEPTDQDSSKMLLDFFGQTGLIQFLLQQDGIPPEALPRLLRPEIDAEFYQDWMQHLKDRANPAALVAKLAEMMQMDPAVLQQAIEQVAAASQQPQGQPPGMGGGG